MSILTAMWDKKNLCLAAAIKQVSANHHVAYKARQIFHRPSINSATMDINYWHSAGAVSFARKAWFFYVRSFTHPL